MVPNLMEIKNMRVTVLGAARSGIAAGRLLMNHGANVFISDHARQEEKPEVLAGLQQLDLEFELGGHSDRILEADFAVLSPGIPVRSEVVQSLLAKKIPVYSEIEVAFWFCRSPLIAVTGSNGKTTTTTLIGEMLRRQYPNAIVAGNIGQPFSEFVNNSQEAVPAVVEVSSFQLETIDRFRPDTAVVLNFAPNHLDRYDSYEDYLKAKWRITKNLTDRDLLVYNGADEVLTQWAAALECPRQSFHTRCGTDADICLSGDTLYMQDEKFMELKDIRLRGIHNTMNVMAAVLAAVRAGISLHYIREVAASFPGVEHRLEFVAEIDGVRYINDSKATTVESLSYALQSFEEPIILIAGGKDKGSDFTRLNDLIQSRVRELVLIGHASDKMAGAWGGLKPVHRMDSLRAAVEKARSLAGSGDVVLLSPACASFDMFSDFEDRGRQFKQLIRHLEGVNETE